MSTRLNAMIIARQLEAKLGRISRMNKSYAFRLAAIIASDNRPGKEW